MMNQDVRRMARLQAVEGLPVSPALTDGSRIDDAPLISAGRGLRTIWVFINGADAFLPLAGMVEVSEPGVGIHGAAA